MVKVRPPSVAGQFYAGSESSLQRQVEKCYTHEYGPGEIPEVKAGPRNILGLVSPHAGYPFSGPVAAHGFASLAEDGVPQTVVLVGPAHRRRQGVFIDSCSVWRTPLGETKVDSELVRGITSRSEFVEEDSVAHFEEHSLEVQLPFLQHLFGSDFMITPLIMGLGEMNLDTSVKLGGVVEEAIEDLDRDALVLASSDFIHYGIAYGYTPISGDFSEVWDWMRKVDGETIDKIKELDVNGFYEVLDEYDSTTCGYGAIATVMSIMKELNANVELLKYATSAETTGRKETSQIVGYSSILFRKRGGED